MTKKRFIIISILVAAILFTLISVNTSKEEWNSLFSEEAREEDFNKLSEIAYDIIESRNIMKPSSEHLRSYSATVKTDGTITLKLTGKSTINLLVILSKDFQIQYFEKQDITIPFFIVALIILWGNGIIATAIINVIFKAAKKIYKKFKKT